MSSRSPVDVVGLPYAFSQQAPLDGRAFIDAARERGVRLTLEHLDDLHRLRLLVPLYRFRRDLRAIRAHSGADDRFVRHHARWRPQTGEDLRELHTAGRLFPAGSRFIAREQRRQTEGGTSYLASDYVYSAFQLPVLRTAGLSQPFVRRRSGRVRLDTNAWWRAHARQRSTHLNSLAVVLEAIAPLYWSKVTGRVTGLGAIEDFARFDQWRRECSATEILTWLGLDAEWMRSEALGLLRSADEFDPLGDWLAVIREAEPDGWKRLRGDARLAIDFRTAAELLLRVYEAAVEEEGGKAELDNRELSRRRLSPRRQLDDVLTEFGLSPHPRLLLIVEGKTELILFPRVLEHFKVRSDAPFITLVDTEGAGRDITLISYAAPRTTLEPDGRYLNLERPLTRILVVQDAENAMATKKSREARRRAWVQRLARTLPPEAQTASVLETLELIVRVETWNEQGDCFEFAHFTDDQIAAAWAAVDRRLRQPSADERVRAVASLRAQRGNVKTLAPGLSKGALADALWPALETNLREADSRGHVEDIPIVRVLDHATDLAGEFPHRGLVIALK